VTRLTAQLVGPKGQAVGVDLNPDMLCLARTIAQHRFEITPKWVGGNAETLPFPDGYFDAVLCQQGLQFFADKKRALREMNRVLTFGGRLALSVMRGITLNPYQHAVARSLSAYLTENALEGVCSPFALGDVDELHLLVLAAGFSDIHIRIETKIARFKLLESSVPGYLSATPAASETAALNDDAWEAIIRYTRNLLQPYLDHDEYAIPISFHVVMAKKNH
jgi:SAM-dependent methyltransferase